MDIQVLVPGQETTKKSETAKQRNSPKLKACYGSVKRKSSLIDGMGFCHSLVFHYLFSFFFCS